MLQERGASFFAEIARETGHLQSQVEDALWELSAAGVVTAMASTICVPCWIRSAVRDARNQSGHEMARAAGHCLLRGAWNSILPSRPLASSFDDMASCFEICWRGNR
jgi:hypothetical protein